jgi:sugar phosphate isomerase/epimerase
MAWLGATGIGGAAELAFFAMDTGTRDAQHQTAESQVALVKELGFDGIGPCYTTPEALRDMLAAVDRQHSKMFALYLRLDLDAGAPVSPEIRDSISQLKGRDTILWLWVTTAAHQPSDPAGDVRAVPVMREVADLAQQAGLRVALYPHAGIWVERVDDAVRLARQVERKNFGVTFNLCHWLMVDGKELDARLELARPNLLAVTINGADAGGKDWGKLIQPLDSGTFDAGRVLAKLKQIGYGGPVGLQHYGIQGDARANLQRSMNGWRHLQGVAMKPAGQALAAWEPTAGWSEVGNVRLDPQDPGRLASEPGTGVVVSQGGGQFLATKECFGDVAVHVEFMIPRQSNSGLYFLGSHEVQILDSFGVAKSDYPGNECGGIYPEWINDANVRGHSPLVNASKPAGEWQTYDVIYRAPRFAAAGKKTRNARFEKVLLNGKLVQKDVEVLGPTRLGQPEQATGPLRLQGDHGAVAYRNVRIRTP